VDLNEAAQRILRRHWVLILLLTLIGVSIPIALIRMQEDSYVATARIMIGAADTRDGQEATALADMALALATSREVVGRALNEADVHRDPVALAEDVQVEPVGTSGVLELSVTDGNAKASAAIVNALATEIVRMRDEAVAGDTRAELVKTEEQLAAVAQQIAAIEDEAYSAVGRVGNVDAIALEHSQAMERQRSLEAQRQQLLQTLTAAVLPRVIDASSTKGVLVPVGRMTRLALGGLLGLVLAVALAATRESFRPTLSGAAIARYLGAPLLARLPRAPRGDTGVSDPWLANYLTLTADAAGVDSVQLVPVGRWVDVTRLARDLDRDGGPRVVPLLLAPEGPHDGMQPRLPAGQRAGIVVVTPDVVKGTAMFEELERHAELARRPIIGVITYRGRGGPRRSDAGATAQHRPSADAVNRPTTTPTA
jgi:capsular polysaccharide biosynthesis protein